jgi:hypothetical protein
MLTPPVDHPLDLTTQAVLTYGSWGLTLAVVGIALRMCFKEGTPLYLLMVLAAMVGAFAEPLYDAGLMLYFYSGPAMHTHFTAFDIPQPVWTHSGYAVLYASAAVFIARQIGQGRLTRRALYAWAGIELLMSSAFEMIGINGFGSGGAYEYWGPHVFRIFEYPLVIGVLESAQVICFSVAAALLRARSSGSWLPLLDLFLLFPCTFYLANFGAGAPTVVALHLENTTPAIVALGSLLSIAGAGLLIRAAAGLLPEARVVPAAGSTIPTARVTNPKDPSLAQA